ncbi:hypothetical protein NIES4102_34020 [Chondrocystis sp. NIES-4102]|nr:hypothetical protein NIES4102_34020 [Chondrocystis sp. NIES-4102]
MTQTLADLFRATATKSGSTITINLKDFDDSNGANLLADPINASPAKACAAWLSWLHKKTSPP